MANNQLVFTKFSQFDVRALPKIDRLTANDVHVWFFELQTADFSFLFSLLSPKEIIRANRLKQEIKKKRFIISHGIQRLILGCYLNLAPQNVVFEISATGKPFIPNSFLNFNISHSADFCLLALSQNRKIGVDIEVHRKVNLNAIAKKFFSPKESQFILSQTPAAQQQKFFLLWCCKEAFVKAIGSTLAAALSTLEVDLSCTKFLKLIARDGQPVSDGWDVREFYFQSDLTAIVVSEI